MRSKTPLTLMEQLIMILVFALAAALCLQAFALSRQVSREMTARDQALLLAQNTAETLKATGGEFSSPDTRLEEGFPAGEGRIWYDEIWKPSDDQEGPYYLEIRRKDASVPGLAAVDIVVGNGDTPLVCLTAAWQQEGGRHG